MILFIMNFLKKMFSPTILILSSALLIYTLYRSEIIYGGDKRNYYFTYYVISLFLIFFSIITFYINTKIKEYFIIICASLFISVYILEGYLTFKINKKYRIYEKTSGKKWDRRSPIEIYNDLKKEDNQITISIRATLHELDDYSIFSLGGVSNSKTIHCNENGYYSIYESDRYGFNNPDIEWDSKEIEYLLIGDSFTHGSCVNRPNDIGSVLRNLSNNKSVLNLGYRGNGPLTEYATLKEYLSPKVNKVLWIYYPNDLSGLTKEKNQRILSDYFNDTTFTQSLKFKQDLINRNIKKFIAEYEKRLEKKEKKSRIKEFIKIYNLRTFFLGKKEEVISAPLSDFRKVLLQAQAITMKNNSKLYFIHLPSYYRYAVSGDKAEIIDTYISIKEIVEELGIPFVDIHEEVFKKEKNPLDLVPFEELGHYTVEGYKKVSQAIYQNTND